jgi:hypothetical protein
MSLQAVGQNSAQPVVSNTTAQGTQAAAGTSSSGQVSSSTASAQASYTVSISNAARAVLAEATETSVQTAQEAGHGDRQAQRLLAKEQAAKAA